MFEQDLVVYLITGSASLSALQDSRVYPAPLGERRNLPATTFQLIPGSMFVKAHDGPTGLNRWHYQFDVWGRTKLEAKQVGEALTDTLDNLTGTSSYINDYYDNFEEDT